MTEEKAHQLFEDVRKLHTPDRPTVTSEPAPSEPQAQSARSSVAPGSASDGIHALAIVRGLRERIATLEASEKGLKREVAQLEKNCTQIYDAMKKVEAEAKFFQTLVQSHRSVSSPNIRRSDTSGGQS